MVEQWAVPVLVAARTIAVTFKPGDVGENFVQLWASQVGITANAARRDEFGWDYVFQIRREGAPSARVPLDRLPPEMTCMVQVKTHLGRATGSDISLANWQRRFLIERDAAFK
jgi:hypothetical protein